MMRRHLPLLLLLVFLPAACAQRPVPVPKPTVAKPAPPAALPGTRTFCVFGDAQTAGDPQRLQILSRLAAAMAVEKPEVAVSTGDLIDGANSATAQRQQYDAFFRALKPLQALGPVSFAAAPGNHDTGAGMGGVWEGIFGRRYYSFNLGSAHLVILDSQQPRQYGRIEGAQWDWLCRDLTAAQRSAQIFVFVHQPLFPVSVHRGSSLDKYTKFRDRLHMLFAQAKVNAVFSGHEHLYSHQKRDGVNYFITGGGGAPPYADAAHGGFYHYLRVSFTESEYEVAVKRLE
jgi:3',5'-cyclic AMP phosphodiesterase CpdA